MTRTNHLITEPNIQPRTQNKKPYTLNKKQTRLLNLLFKFRFITVPLLARYLQVTEETNERALHILTRRDLVARHYDASYKLHGIAARYYLAKEQLSTLPVILDVDSATLHPFYKNDTVSKAYVDHHITLLDIYVHLTSCYPDTFRVYTRYELAGTDMFPSTKPDMYIDSQRGNKEYFLELADNIQSFVARKRFDSLLQFFYEESWDEDRNPILLFVLPNVYTEAKFQKHAARKLDNAGMEDELMVLTTTIAAITKNDSNPKIWTDVMKPKQLRSLQ